MKEQIIRLKIDGRDTVVDKGTSILHAAQSLGKTIPTLCHNEEVEHFTSCMMCVVENKKNGALIPSCSVNAEEGMDVLTDSEKVLNHRKSCLELLISEHVGECESPCTRFCPAHMNIPEMMRLIAQGREDEALRVVKEKIPIPAILGRICPAPCEKGCRRKEIDTALPICTLKGHVGVKDLGSANQYIPECRAETHKKVAIIGAGPAGITAAYYLRISGHSCTLYDDKQAMGGTLLSVFDEDILSFDVVEKETSVLQKMGVDFCASAIIGEDITIDKLEEEYDCIVLAIGTISDPGALSFPVKTNSRGIVISKKTFQTDNKKYFACGGCVAPNKMAIRSVGQARQLAIAVDQYLLGIAINGEKDRFSVVIKKLLDNEKKEYLKEVMHISETILKEKTTPGNASKQAAQCLHCDCRKSDNCKLRDLSDLYGVDSKKYTISKRKPIIRKMDHPEIVFESSKCVRCGICLRLTQKHKEPYGTTFVGRGYDVNVSVPFDKALELGVQSIASILVDACPTGAIAFKKG